jgi:hypothetical protein
MTRLILADSRPTRLSAAHPSQGLQVKGECSGHCRLKVTIEE